MAIKSRLRDKYGRYAKRGEKKEPPQRDVKTGRYKRNPNKPAKQKTPPPQKTKGNTYQLIYWNKFVRYSNQYTKEHNLPKLTAFELRYNYYIFKSDKVPLDNIEEGLYSYYNNIFKPKGRPDLIENHQKIESWWEMQNVIASEKAAGLYISGDKLIFDLSHISDKASFEVILTDSPQLLYRDFVQEVKMIAGVVNGIDLIKKFKKDYLCYQLESIEPFETNTNEYFYRFTECISEEEKLKRELEEEEKAKKAEEEKRKIVEIEKYKIDKDVEERLKTKEIKSKNLLDALREKLINKKEYFQMLKEI